MRAVLAITVLSLILSSCDLSANEETTAETIFRAFFAGSVGDGQATVNSSVGHPDDSFNPGTFAGIIARYESGPLATTEIKYIDPDPNSTLSNLIAVSVTQPYSKRTYGGELGLGSMKADVRTALGSPGADGIHLDWGPQYGTWSRPGADVYYISGDRAIVVAYDSNSLVQEFSEVALSVDAVILAMPSNCTRETPC